MNRAAYEAILERLGVGPTDPCPANAAEASRLLAMPLDVFADQGHLLEVRVPWWPETLWFVPSGRDIEALRSDDVARHRVWTAAELMSLMSSPPLSLGALRILTVVRREFDGELVEVRSRTEEPTQ